MTKQESIFPEMELAKKTEREITELHNACKRMLAKLPEYAKFVKLFGEYTTVLDGAQTDEADELTFKNVEFAIQQSGKLHESLKNVREKLAMAREKFEELEILNKRIEAINTGVRGTLKQPESGFAGEI